ncbi:MAG: hypothetical protein MI741_01150, partial [Rhodospirillales bacterium]|nr:hypothetical protein [Rhodospirillales bacterium]
MDRDRWTQLVALIVLASCLVGSAALVPAINTMRRKEQISVKTELGKGTPPKYVIAATAAGSFRGLAANILWYRCEMLKREGKFFEAYALADWICTLQPRFPHVWSFHAWNMAYNISVETSTPEERWHWVNRGIRLLREEGIPNNPDAVRLYRELGWILFHKVGQFSDDMHWYYKREMAREWQEVLGDFGRVPEGIALPSDGEKIKLPSRREIFAEHLRPIVAMADTYIAFHRPTEDMRKLIEEIGRLDPDRRDELARFLTMNMETLRDELTEYEKKLNEDQRQLRAEV